MGLLGGLIGGVTGMLGGGGAAAGRSSQADDKQKAAKLRKKVMSQAIGQCYKVNQGDAETQWYYQHILKHQKAEGGQSCFLPSYDSYG